MYPFEIHITVEVLPASRLPAFVEVCQQLQAKPLLIELARGATATQPMLSKMVQRQSLAEALAVAAADAEFFGRHDLPATRIKIETAPHYSHLAVSAGSRSLLSYFEWHGKVSYERTDALLALCLAHKAHLSRNALKGQINTRFITLREFGTIGVFQTRVAALTAALYKQWPLLKQESECCLYDSNTALDAGWLPQ